MTTVYDAAYQGTRGSNSEDACIDLLSATANLLPRTTLEDVFNAVARGEARYGVVPVENTLAGSIHRCYDLLFEHDLKIIGETVRHILFALIAPPGVGLVDVRKALSHPVALAQCERFFREHPQIQPISVYDTAGAVEIVMNEGSRDAAAVATRRAATVYGGQVLAEAIQDHLENYTRFLLITPHDSPEPPAQSGEYKTTIVFSVGNSRRSVSLVAALCRTPYRSRKDRKPPAARFAIRVPVLSGFDRPRRRDSHLGCSGRIARTGQIGPRSGNVSTLQAIRELPCQKPRVRSLKVFTR
jgi:prephenate dehydratase